mgnify:CR=1 FL=1
MGKLLRKPGTLTLKRQEIPAVLLPGVLCFERFFRKRQRRNVYDDDNAAFDSSLYC